MASVEDLRARSAEIRAEIREIDTEFAGELLPEEAKSRWHELNEELELVEATIEELEARKQVVEDLSRQADHVEPEPKFKRGPRVASRVPDDPTQFEQYRVMATSLDELTQAHKDGARKLLERSFQPAHPSVSREEAQGDIDKLIERDPEVAMRMITTSSRGYAKEFETYMKTQGRVVGQEMERTASLTTTAGGFAVPVELDTTLILANAGVVNPIRNLARVRQTNVNHVEFVNTAGITAGFGAEAAEATDNAPVLAQPVVDIERAHAFVPMTIEIAEDWAGIQQDLAVCFADAKNQLESDQFLNGLGHASHAPVGLIAPGGSTAVVTTASSSVVAIADLYSLELGLSPRYRTNASFVGSKAMFQGIRGFATSLGPSAWSDNLRQGYPGEILGYPAVEWSAYSAATTTTGATVLTFGDFNYFAIVDRVGMNVEFIQHLFGGSSTTHYPTGQRGLYMWWRTSSNVLTPTLQSVSAFVSLKVK